MKGTWAPPHTECLATVCEFQDLGFRLRDKLTVVDGAAECA